MTVILEKRDIPVVSVAFAVKSGGVNETEKEKGISHFIEHMLYKGTKKRSRGKIAYEIERNGGVLDGFTSETITAYWCKMPSRHLDIALDVLSDLVKNPLFDEKEIDKERNVIFEEIDLHKDNPSRYALEEIHNLLYEKPFGMNLAGTKEILSKLDKNKLVEWFKVNYVPENMILVVVGEADFDSLVEFAEKNFSKKSTPSLSLPKIIKKNEIKEEIRNGMDQANLSFAYHVPLVGERGEYAARVLSVLMVGGMSSRLFKELREKRDLVYAITGGSDINKTFSYNIIYLGTSNKNVDEAKRIVLKEFENVSKSLSEKELKEIKEQIIGNYYISMEDSQEQMVNLLSSEISGNAKEFYDFEKNIREVKLKEIKEIAGNALKKHSFFSLLPN